MIVGPRPVNVLDTALPAQFQPMNARRSKAADKLALGRKHQDAATERGDINMAGLVDDRATMAGPERFAAGIFLEETRRIGVLEFLRKSRRGGGDNNGKQYLSQAIHGREYSQAGPGNATPNNRRDPAGFFGIASHLESDRGQMTNNVSRLENRLHRLHRSSSGN